MDRDFFLLVPSKLGPGPPSSPLPGGLFAALRPSAPPRFSAPGRRGAGGMDERPRPAQCPDPPNPLPSPIRLPR